MTLGIARSAILSVAILCARDAAPPDGASSIRQVGTLRPARSVHTATTLATGEVLIAGGMVDGGGSVARVEIFDLSSNTLRNGAPLAHARAGHTATTLRDGRVLIAGGYDGTYLASMELYDPATKTFRDGGAMTEGRSGHTATLLSDGRVLFTGGVGDGWTFLRTAEIYDPATRRSSAVGSMQLARESHMAALLRDGRVLIVGGHANRRPNVVIHTLAEVFDPATQTFASAGSMSTPRHKHDTVTLPDGRVLVIGGADVTDRVHFATTEIWDPATSAFTAGPAMRERRYKIAGTSVVLPGGDVLVTSGSRVAELLDHRRGTFTPVRGELPDALRFSATALLADGDVLISGGYSDGNRASSGVWRVRRSP